jgi:SH3 domain
MLSLSSGALTSIEDQQAAHQSYYVYYYQYYEQYYEQYNAGQKLEQTSDLAVANESLSTAESISSTHVASPSVSLLLASDDRPSTAFLIKDIGSTEPELCSPGPLLTLAAAPAEQPAASVVSSGLIDLLEEYVPGPMAVEPKASPPTALPRVRVQVLFSNPCLAEGDLPITPGQILVVLNQDGDWWYGHPLEDETQEGLFPSNYVKLLPPEQALPPLPRRPTTSPSTSMKREQSATTTTTG